MLGALVSVMTVWLVTGILLFEAIQRIITPEAVDGKSALEGEMWLVPAGWQRGWGLGCSVVCPCWDPDLRGLLLPQQSALG